MWGGGGGENPSRSWLLDWGRSGYRVASRRVIQLPNPSLCVSPEWLFFVGMAFLLFTLLD